MDKRAAILAGNTYRDTLATRYDGRSADGMPLWHGWAIMEGFLAGARWQDEQLKAEVANLREMVTTFGGVWAAQYAKDAGWPEGELHPKHYDMLAEAGARMTGFKRRLEA